MRSVYSFRIVKLWNYMTGFFPLVYEWIYFLCINLIMFIITWASCGKACISHIVYSPSIKALSSCLRRRWLPGSPCPLWTRMGNLLRNLMSFHDDRGLNGKTYKKKLHIAVEMNWTVLWPIGSSPHKPSTTIAPLPRGESADPLWFNNQIRKYESVCYLTRGFVENLSKAFVC